MSNSNEDYNAIPMDDINTTESFLNKTGDKETCVRRRWSGDRKKFSRAYKKILAMLGALLGIVVVLVVVGVKVCPGFKCGTPTSQEPNVNGTTGKQIAEMCSSSDECNEALVCLRGKCQCSKNLDWNGKNCVIREQSCIYKTNQDILQVLEKDPFGDACSADAPECKSGQATQQCEKCNDDTKFPQYCFCDRKEHCAKPDMGFNVKAHDHPSKSNCSFCSKAFILTNFTSRGNCTCSDPNRPDSHLNCTCNPGYGGFMCSAVLERVCKVINEKLDLQDCKLSNDEKCLLDTTKEGKSMFLICESFTDSNVMYKELASCDAGS